MKIPYIEKPLSPAFSKIFQHTKSIYKPLITAVLRNGEKKQKLFALVDSGADACLFPKGVADQLGLDIRSGNRVDFAGLGGNKSPFYFHDIEILFGQYQIKTKVGFSTSYDIGVGGILVQLGFFEEFLISFDHKNKCVEIKKPGLLDNLASRFSLNIL